MAEMYESHGLHDVAAAFGVSYTTARRYLHRHGVALRPRGMKLNQYHPIGPLHHKWGGGRVKKRHYWVLREPEHPYANYGYVFEHRRVVELHLQQNEPDHPGLGPDGYLRRDWCVHHRNGDKEDNRLENLEPMPRSQHNSALHYTQEIDRLRGLLDAHGINWRVAL